MSQELARWRAARYSDVRYKLTLTLEKMSPVLKGTMEIRVNHSVLSETEPVPKFIILDWRKVKGHEEKSTISNVSINGREVRVMPSRVTLANVIIPKGATLTAFEHNEHLIFHEGVVVGENVIKLDFTSPILPSGSAITRYIDKEDGSEYIYSLFVPSDASTAFPVFDQPDLKARFTLSTTVPIGWTTVSNGGGFCLAMDGIDPIDATGCTFEITKPISTYVFAFAAGPWQQVSEPGAVATGEFWVTTRLDGATAKAPVATAPGSESRGSVFVRKSQLTKFQPHAAEVFRLNREGVKFLEEYFNYKFPFPKYDLVLIPEFPFGGMEHAGATFLRESAVIFPSEPTANDHISRANLIFHEAAHQWFGDTVTMKWFDDLWLKEGFAEFMAYKTLERVMPQYNAWKAFYERNKPLAYQTDSTKGTTPIYQEIKNLNSAKSAYGNIVYRKAPSFLKQAEFYLGPDKFQTAVRAFLKKHEFGNAEWIDLVSEFESSSKMSLSAWATKWVTQAGVRRYRFTGMAVAKVGDPMAALLVELDEPKLGVSGTLTCSLEIRINVLSIGAGRRETTDYIPFGVHTVAGNGLPAPACTWSTLFLGKGEQLFLFPNYRDFGYGIFLLDDKSREYVLKNIQNEKDDFLRSMMWGALWDSVREGELDPKEYVALATRNLPAEKDEMITAAVLSRVATAINSYLDDTARAALTLPLEQMIERDMLKAGSAGRRITFYRGFLSVGASMRAREVYKKILHGKFWPKPAVMGGLIVGGNTEIPIKTKDKFDIVTRLASLNDPDADKLLAELEKTETSDDAKRYAYAARAAFPTKETKEKYWNDFVSNNQISESWIEGAFGPFNSVRHADLTLPYLDRALRELPNHKRNRKIFFVNGWLAAFIGGQKSEEARAIVNKFLADNPNLDRDLRLKVLENVDVIERAVKIRRKYQN